MFFTMRSTPKRVSHPEFPQFGRQACCSAAKFDAKRQCMFGGARPKKTTIARDIAELEELECECNGQHAYLPWGRTPHGFATAAEVEYPVELCKRWANIILQVVTKDAGLPTPILPSHPDKEARAQGGRQTRKSLPFMPEWHYVDTFCLDVMPNFTIGAKLLSPG